MQFATWMRIPTHGGIESSAPQPYGLVESLLVLVWFCWRGHVRLHCGVADMLVCRWLLSKWLVGCERSREAEP